MMAMIKNAGYGIEGSVIDSITGLPIKASIFVNNFFPVYTDTTLGDYHEYLLPGTYSLKIEANNYRSKEIENVVVGDQASTVVDVQLLPGYGRYAAKVAAVVIPGNNPLDEANTPAVIGAPDSINYSLGKNGWIILDMQQPVINHAGNDFTVFEGDTTPEGFTCLGSKSMDGPWSSLGTGTGTTSFDLSTAGVDSIRFIKIMDDDDGVQNAANAGFDLDAVEVILPPQGISNSSGNVNSLRISPNPALDRITIETGNFAGQGTLIFFNSEGTEVMTIPMNSPKISVDVRTLGTGLYIVRFVERTNGRMLKSKMVKF